MEVSDDTAGGIQFAREAASGDDEFPAAGVVVAVVVVAVLLPDGPRSTLTAVCKPAGETRNADGRPTPVRSELPGKMDEE